MRRGLTLARAVAASPVVLDRHGNWLRALPVEDGRWRLRADLDRTDPAFLKRVLAVQDARFWLHPGGDRLSWYVDGRRSPPIRSASG